MFRVALDRISFICLASLVVVPAWIFGGVLRGTQVWLVIVALVGLACAVCHLVLTRDDDASDAGVPWLVYGLIAAIALGAIQLVPLDASLHEQLSPQGNRWWLELTEANDQEKLALSLYPASTRADMSLLTLILTALVLACLTITSSTRRLAICGLAAINGAAMAFFGIVQQLSWNGKIYWFVPLTLGGIPFAGYVNRNNAAGYLTMCLGLSLGLFIWSVTRYRMAMNHPAATSLRARENPVRRRMADALASLDTVSILALTSTVFITAGVLSTLSRGATIALIGALLVTIVVVSRVHRGYLSVVSLAVVTIIGLGLTIWLGRVELLQNRFAALIDERGIPQHDGRLGNWRDALGAVPEFFLTGTGMGTYRYVYEPYEARPVESWFYHAENQYLEALVEGGVGGLLLLMLCLVVAGWSISRLLTRAADAETNAFAVAAVFVLASQVIHAVFDFGLYLPANAILLAVVCGASATHARHEGYWSAHAHKFPRVEIWHAVVLSSLVGGAALLGLFELRAAAVVENNERELRLMQIEELQSSEALRSHIERMRHSVQARPDDAESHLQLANLWIALYRAEAVAEMRATLPSAVTDEELWTLSSLNMLHYRAWQFLQSKDTAKWDQLRQQRLVCDYLQPAWDHLQKARQSCPLMAKTHLMLARLSPVFDAQSDVKTYTDRALRMSPGDPNNLFDVGLLELQAGRIDDGIASWRKCLTAAPGYWDEMVLVGTRVLGPINLYRQLLQGMPERIVELAKSRYLGADNRNIRLELLILAEEQLSEADLSAAQRAYLKATIHALREEWLLAIDAFQEAVRKEPHQVEWRYDFARSLLKARLFQQARVHARLCLRMQPRSRKYRAILDEIDRQQKR